MTSDEQTAKGDAPFPVLSKRGARRVIQRALVLAGRERAIRQHLREAELTTLWTIEDWGLEWTVGFDHGRLEFHRGHVGRPQVSYFWQTGEGFLGQIETGIVRKGEFQLIGDPAWRRVVDPVFKSFSNALRAVLADPIDDDGEPLL